MSEFETQREDVFASIVHRNRACHPGGERLILMNETECRQLLQAQEEKAMDAQYVPVEDDAFTVRRKNLIHAGKTIAWTIPAVTFFVGAGEGLMNLYFAGVLAVPFLFLAVGCWLNK